MLIIPAKVATLSIWITKCVHWYFCFTLPLPRGRWWCDCKHIVTLEWLWRNCGEIVVWCYRDRQFLVF